MIFRSRFDLARGRRSRRREHVEAIPRTASGAVLRRGPSERERAAMDAAWR